MRASSWVALTVGMIVSVAGLPRAAGVYPLALVANAEVKIGSTTTTSTFTIRVDRPMGDADQARVTNGFKYGGYAGFLKELRDAPAIGTIELDTRKVELRYAREQPSGSGRRLVLVADRPLYFLAGGNPGAKPREGYELTVVDLQLDDNGAGTGTMAAAARVRPAADGGVVLDDYAETPIRLAVRAGQP